MGKSLPDISKVVTFAVPSESSSAGRARPCQGRGRGFESRLSLYFFARVVELVDTQDLKSCSPWGVRVQVPLRVPHLIFPSSSITSIVSPPSPYRKENNRPGTRQD